MESNYNGDEVLVVNSVEELIRLIEGVIKGGVVLVRVFDSLGRVLLSVSLGGIYDTSKPYFGKSGNVKMLTRYKGKSLRKGIGYSRRRGIGR